MAKCVRFLQCAGFRFDSPSWDGPEGWTALRNQDLWQTFQSVISLCHTEKIELLFINGDLFEQEYVRKETVERVASSLAKLEGTRVFISPGKRDPLIMTSAYRLAVWPSNVHIFSSGVSSVRIPSLNITVSGAGWTAYHQDKSFLKGFKTSGDGTLQLMLLHAEVESEQNTEGFIPIQQEEIASSGLVYLALGHREAYSGIHKAGATFWADCGAPEARSFLENNPQGVLLGEIENESSRFEFRELGQRRYIEINLAIQSPSELGGVAATLLAETSLEERQKNLFRINLSGTVLDFKKVAHTLQNLLETKFRFIEVLPFERETPTNTKASGRVSVAKDNEEYSNLSHVFINKLQKGRLDVKDSETKEYWELVQKIGLAALGQGRKLDED